MTRHGLCLVLLLAALPAAAALAETPLQTATGADAQSTGSVAGLVLDAAGMPVRGARVFLEAADSRNNAGADSDASGKFLLRGVAPGQYAVRATAPGLESARSTLVLTRQTSSDITLVLRTAAGSAGSAAANHAADTIDFADAPSFAVAGVTDWTAVGGHGSDATLRTSEQLNREALALRQANGAAAVADGSALGNRSEDEQRLRSALAADPQSYAANRDLGLQYLHTARFSLAVPLLETASRVHVGQAQDEYNLAQACRGLGDTAAAQAHLKKALATQDRAEFHRFAGDLDEQSGNPLAAVQQFARATQLDPSEPNYFAWGTELLLHRAIVQAAGVLATAAQRYPASARVRTAWGAALFAGAHYSEASQAICDASDLDSHAREPYLFAGQIMLAAPSAGACVRQTLERFLVLHPEDAKANYFSAMMLLKAGTATTAERARQLLLRAVALDPAYAAAYLQLGILAAQRRDYPAAIALYGQAIHAEPQMSEAHYRLGVAYDRTGNAAGAQTEYALHQQLDASNAAATEQERRAVKQFTVDAPGSGEAR